MKRTGTFLLVLVLLIGFTIGSAATKAVAEETVKIGALLDFTGPIAALGPLFKNGIVYALEEVDYTVGGKKVELIVEDTASDPTVALEKAKKLVDRDKVRVIIGPLMGDQQ